MADKEIPQSDEDRQLTPDERRRLRKMLEDDSRARWLYTSIRVWLGYIAGAIIAAAAVQQAVSHWIEAIKRTP